MTPDEFTLRETFLEVGDGHTLYVHEWGNPHAKTSVIYLHGGPGTGCGNNAKSAFDPKQQRVVFFDQRGCGRSLPLGSLTHNTTTDTVEDINKIAAHVGLKTFVLYGGSWGACLALAYGIAHPARVAAIVAWGVFTGAQSEIDYFDKGEFRTNFPEVWQTYLDATPEKHRAHPTKYHYAQMFGDDEQARRVSAAAYRNLEGALLRLDDRFTTVSADDPTFDPTGICTEAFYMNNGCFLPDRHVFNNAHKLTMPVWLVQGRYDFVCPPAIAHELHQTLPNSQLLWTVSGHIPERGMHDVCRALLLQLTV